MDKDIKDATILIVDDEQQVQDLLCSILSKYGVNIATAKTGEEALSIIRSDSTVKLILLDIYLPDCEGCDLLKRILKLSPDAHVIMITGGSDMEIAKKCLENGAKDYIRKPFDIDYLRTSVIAEILPEL